MRVRGRERIAVWLGWLFSCAVVLTGMIALFRFFPDLPEISPAPASFAPLIRYNPASDPAHQRQAGELSAVWSPSLISLPNGIVHPAFRRNHVNLVTPPIDISPDFTLFLERDSITGPERKIEMRPLERRSKMTLSLLRPRETAPPEDDQSERERVRIELSGGLQNAVIDWPRLAFDEWKKQSVSWSVTLLVRFDADGRPVNVLVESPARDRTLNEQVARTAYQSRLIKPAGARDGRVTFWWYRSLVDG